MPLLLVELLETTHHCHLITDGSEELDAVTDAPAEVLERLRDVCVSVF